VRRVHPVGVASADSAASAGLGADRSDDRQRVADRDYQLAAGHGFQWEEGRDYQLAKDVAAECLAGRKRQPRAGRFLADPAVVGWARRDAAAGA
jgi:hypothetical protein